MISTMIAVWLNKKDVDCIARAIGDACEASPERCETLGRLNEEIGLASLRTTSTKTRSMLSRVTSKSHMIMLSDDEHDSLMGLDLPEDLRERILHGI